MAPSARMRGNQINGGLKSATGSAAEQGKVVVNRVIDKGIAKKRMDTKDPIHKVRGPNQFTHKYGDMLFTDAPLLKRRIVEGHNRKKMVTASGDANTSSVYADFSGKAKVPNTAGEYGSKELGELLAVRPAGVAVNDIPYHNIEDYSGNRTTAFMTATLTVVNNGRSNFTTGESIAVLPPTEDTVEEIRLCQKHKAEDAHALRGDLVPLNHELLMAKEAAVRASLKGNNIPKDFDRLTNGSIQSQKIYDHYARAYHAATTFCASLKDGNANEYQDALAATGLDPAGAASADMKTRYQKYVSTVYGGDDVDGDDPIDKAIRTAGTLYASVIFDVYRAINVHRRGITTASSTPGTDQDIYVCA